MRRRDLTISLRDIHRNLFFRHRCRQGAQELRVLPSAIMTVHAMFQEKQSVRFLGRLLWIGLISGAVLLAQPRRFELKADSEAFWRLVDHGAKLEKVAGGFKFTEGPVWDPRGFLYFSDEQGNRLHRLFPDGRTELVLEVGDPDGNTLDRQH